MRGTRASVQEKGGNIAQTNKLRTQLGTIFFIYWTFLAQYTEYAIFSAVDAHHLVISCLLRCIVYSAVCIPYITVSLFWFTSHFICIKLCIVRVWIRYGCRSIIDSNRTMFARIYTMHISIQSQFDCSDMWWQWLWAKTHMNIQSDNFETIDWHQLCNGIKLEAGNANALEMYIPNAFRRKNAVAHTQTHTHGHYEQQSNIPDYSFVYRPPCCWKPFLSSGAIRWYFEMFTSHMSDGERKSGTAVGRGTGWKRGKSQHINRRNLILTSMW